MKITALLDAIPHARLLAGDGSIEVDRVELDSRAVHPGALFCCIVGTSGDGHEHAAAAVEAGAAALLVERVVPGLEDLGVPVIGVRPGEARRATAVLSSLIVGDPSAALLMVGVTGTNGKTTVATVLGEMLAHAGYDATVIGTLTGSRTTPPAPELQRHLAVVRDSAQARGRIGAVAMEVSSHALDQRRVDGICFDVAIFTNLTHDHLDYHGTMEAYFEAKALLFEPQRSKMAVIWSESDAGRALLDRRVADAVAVSMADASDVQYRPDGISFLWRGRLTSTALVGRTGLIDALLTMEAALVIGIEPDVVVAAIARASGVPGRMERVDVGDAGPTVIVDYAHTPDALSVALDTMALLAADGGRVIVVVGCGGDRDASKRPEMGAIASEKADVVFVTSDNPRHEDPARIAGDVVAGARGNNVHLELDRRAAITAACRVAATQDVILIAGKGHETTQQIGDDFHPFDDRLVAREVLEELRAC